MAIYGLVWDGIIYLAALPMPSSNILIEHTQAADAVTLLLELFSLLEEKNALHLIYQLAGIFYFDWT